MAALQSGYINAHDAEEALRPAIGAAGIAAPYWRLASASVSRCRPKVSRPRRKQ